MIISQYCSEKSLQWVLTERLPYLWYLFTTEHKYNGHGWSHERKGKNLFVSLKKNLSLLRLGCAWFATRRIAICHPSGPARSSKPTKGAGRNFIARIKLQLGCRYGAGLMLNSVVMGSMILFSVDVVAVFYVPVTCCVALRRDMTMMMVTTDDDDDEWPKWLVMLFFWRQRIP